MLELALYIFVGLCIAAVVVQVVVKNVQIYRVSKKPIPPRNKDWRDDIPERWRVPTKRSTLYDRDAA